ncbi:MAG: FecR family protein [Steroidobacteraceae bacterium]
MSAVLAACIALILLGSWPALRDSPPVPAPTTVYRSRSGHRKEIRLADGSTVTLGAETSLSVTLDRFVRHLTLNRGRALFDVAHYSRWPFVVEAGSGTITDVDTAFIVDRTAHKVVVTVTQGAVDVAWRPRKPPIVSSSAPLARVALSPIRLHVGQRLTYTELGVIRRRNGVDTKVAASWALPPVEFLNRSLGGVVRAIQPYYPLKISVSPAASRLRLTALVFPAASDLGGWISGLPLALPVRVITTQHRVCVLLRSPTRARCGTDHRTARIVGK